MPDKLEKFSWKEKSSLGLFHVDEDDYIGCYEWKRFTSSKQFTIAFQ